MKILCPDVVESPSDVTENVAVILSCWQNVTDILVITTLPAL